MGTLAFIRSQQIVITDPVLSIKINLLREWDTEVELAGVCPACNGRGCNAHNSNNPNCYNGVSHYEVDEVLGKVLAKKITDLANEIINFLSSNTGQRE